MTGESESCFSVSGKKTWTKDVKMAFKARYF